MFFLFLCPAITSILIFPFNIFDKINLLQSDKTEIIYFIREVLTTYYTPNSTLIVKVLI